MTFAFNLVANQSNQLTTNRVNCFIFIGNVLSHFVTSFEMAIDSAEYINLMLFSKLVKYLQQFLQLSKSCAEAPNRCYRRQQKHNKTTIVSLSLSINTQIRVM